MAISLALTLICASVVGSFAGRLFRRNLLPAAMQAACYLSGYLILWAITYWLLTATIVYSAYYGLVDPISGSVDVDMGSIWLGIWGAANLLALAVYLFLLYRITAATRYSNH